MYTYDEKGKGPFYRMKFNITPFQRVKIMLQKHFKNNFSKNLTLIQVEIILMKIMPPLVT